MVTQMPKLSLEMCSQGFILRCKIHFEKSFIYVQTMSQCFLFCVIRIFYKLNAIKKNTILPPQIFLRNFDKYQLDTVFSEHRPDEGLHLMNLKS